MHERRLAADARVLDVFTGTGALAIVAALDGAREVSAVDASRRAVLNARINARLNSVEVRALWGDLFGPVFGERFDLIVANPPYVPGEGAPPTSGHARAWEGGADGRALIDRLCSEAPEHLAAGGRLLLVHSSISGERRTLDRLAAAGLEAGVLARERGPLGPVVGGRATLLERRGILKPGEREEEIVVVQGSAA